MSDQDPVLMNDIELQDAYLEKNLSAPIDVDIEHTMLDQGLHPSQQF
jgi:hypothetical protein